MKVDRLATVSQLYFPMGVAVSSSNHVYISDDNYIKKIDRRGFISTIAGTGISVILGYKRDGDSQLAVHTKLSFPRGLFVTEEEEVLFCDCLNNRVRKIDRNGKISTVAGTGEEGYNGDGILATDAQLNNPTSVFVYKNEMYISDTNNDRIRKVLQNGMIKTIAGTGDYGYDGDDQPATNALLADPHGIHVYNDHVYFSDYYNHRVRKIFPNRIIKTIAGTGIHGYNGDGRLAT